LRAYKFVVGNIAVLTKAEESLSFRVKGNKPMEYNFIADGTPCVALSLLNKTIDVPGIIN